MENQANLDYDLIVRAAKYWLQYNGQRGTAKQITNMINRTPAYAILTNAEMRGFKA